MVCSLSFYLCPVCKKFYNICQKKCENDDEVHRINAGCFKINCQECLNKQEQEKESDTEEN